MSDNDEPRLIRVQAMMNLAGLGVGAYRFSVSWPRVMPEPGQVSQKGLDLYRRLVDGLHPRGVTPFVTLVNFSGMIS